MDESSDQELYNASLHGHLDLGEEGKETKNAFLEVF